MNFQVDRSIVFLGIKSNGSLCDLASLPKRRGAKDSHHSSPVLVARARESVHLLSLSLNSPKKACRRSRKSAPSTKVCPCLVPWFVIPVSLVVYGSPDAVFPFRLTSLIHISNPLTRPEWPICGPLTRPRRERLQSS